MGVQAPASSFVVYGETHEEMDQFWEKLSAGGKPGQCGWHRDKHGVSWQVVPTDLGELMTDKEPQRSERVMKARLQMKKLNIQGLKPAYELQ